MKKYETPFIQEIMAPMNSIAEDIISTPQLPEGGIIDSEENGPYFPGAW